MQRPRTADAETMRATVLVVDDEVLGRIVLVDELVDCGYHVLEASSADEAWRVLGSGAEVDVLVTDIRMPGSMDGADLALITRAEFPDIAVLVVSADKPRGELVRDVHGYFQKPYAVEAVREHVSALLKSSNLATRLERKMAAGTGDFRSLFGQQMFGPAGLATKTR